MNLIRMCTDKKTQTKHHFQYKSLNFLGVSVFKHNYEASRQKDCIFAFLLHFLMACCKSSADSSIFKLII